MGSRFQKEEKGKVYEPRRHHVKQAERIKGLPCQFASSNVSHYYHFGGQH